MENLYSETDVVLIKSFDILKVVRAALSKIDPRLINHGERVAYIAMQIYEELPEKASIDIQKLFVLCLLHDIGAYKTNEIDDMVRFETDTVFDHSLYGYLFLKNITRLSEFSEAILHHHTDYSETRNINKISARYAEIINLADRADILLTTPMAKIISLKRLAGTKFNPRYVDALIRADEKRGILKCLEQNTYFETCDNFVRRLDIKSIEIMDYLKLLVYAIDFRSPYTVTHTADTTIISVETGKLLRLNDHDIQSLYIGAFLHDIGKIAIPNDILEKPGQLTPEEFNIIKRHIPEGEQILRGVVNNEVCDIALRHHEKLDGSGYSLGLKSESLTLPQRIMAVADILSALSQRRSYKEPYPKCRVIDILTYMRDAGKLCPLVVNTVCENYDMILQNTAISHDPVKVMYDNLASEYLERSKRTGRKASNETILAFSQIREQTPK